MEFIDADRFRGSDRVMVQAVGEAVSTFLLSNPEASIPVVFAVLFQGCVEVLWQVTEYAAPVGYSREQAFRLQIDTAIETIVKGDHIVTVGSG